MSTLKQYFYNMRFEELMRNKFASEFEDFFSDIMKEKHKENFMCCVPWGREGDRKNDGYMVSEKHLFAVNGPKSLNQNRMITKINSDFEKAKPYWAKYIKKWSFVTNQPALPPKILEKFLELKENNSEVSISHWGYQEIRSEIFSLDNNSIERLLGSVPNASDFFQVQFEDIQPVIEAIKVRYNTSDANLLQVPSNKLTINGFSNETIDFIKMGMTKANLVKEYFDAQKDITLADDIAEVLTEKYNELKQNNTMSSDDIFGELYSFLCDDNKRNDTKYVAAIFSVLSYYFEQCTIFESV